MVENGNYEPLTKTRRRGGHRQYAGTWAPLHDRGRGGTWKVHCATWEGTRAASFPHAAALFAAPPTRRAAPFSEENSLAVEQVRNTQLGGKARLATNFPLGI